jgi:hypothetical protein
MPINGLFTQNTFCVAQHRTQQRGTASTDLNFGRTVSCDAKFVFLCKRTLRNTL